MTDTKMTTSEALTILSLKEGATALEIRKSHRKLALKYHPDKNKDPSALEMFEKVNAAYDLLIGKKTKDDSPEAADIPSAEYVMPKVAGKFDIDLVKKHIENNEINYKLENGDSLFLRAAKLLKENCIKLLLKQKDLDVNFQDTNGNSAIKILAGHVNAQSAANEYIPILYAKGGDLNLPSKDGYTPLMTAVTVGNLDLVTYLLKNNVDLQAITKQGHSALDLAKINNAPDKIIKLLADAQEKDFLKDKDVFSLVYTFRDATPDQVKKWISNGIDKNAIVDEDDNTSLLMHYIKQGNIPVAEILINAGAKLTAVDSNGNTPLLLASQIHDKDISNKLVNLMLKKNPDLDAQNKLGYSALMHAAEAQNSDLVKLLVDHKASVSLVSGSKRTAKDFATTANLNKDIINLLEFNEEAEFITNSNLDGFLSKHKTLTFIELKKIINDGFDVNATGKDGMTLLKFFVMAKNLEAVRFLVDKKVNIDQQDSDNNTPLILAAKADYTEIATFLVDRQANMNVQNNNNKTALMFAAELGNKILTDLLVKSGAQTTLTSDEGKTAEDYAASKLASQWTKGNTGDVVSTLKTSIESASIAKKDLAKLMKDKKDEVSFEQAKTWLEQGLDVNAEGKNKVSLLTYFAAKHNSQAITYLVIKKADVNHQDATGKTALHFLSSIKGNVAKAWGYSAPDNAAAKFIIDSRAADLCLSDKLGLTVYRNILNKGNTDLKEYIDATGFVELIDCAGRLPIILPIIDGEL